MSTTVDLKRDFSPFPAGRVRSDGRYSGQAFREDVLLPRLKEAAATQGKVVVELDTAAGYGSSFLEEAFGGLVRVNGYSAADLEKLLELRSQDEMLIAEIWQYIHDADRPSRKRAAA